MVERLALGRGESLPLKQCAKFSRVTLHRLELGNLLISVDDRPGQIGLEARSGRNLRDCP